MWVQLAQIEKSGVCSTHKLHPWVTFLGCLISGWNERHVSLLHSVHVCYRAAAPNTTRWQKSAVKSLFQQDGPPTHLTTSWLSLKMGAAGLKSPTLVVNVFNHEPCFFTTCCLLGLGLFVKTALRELCPQSPPEARTQVQEQWPGKRLQSYFQIQTGYCIYQCWWRNCTILKCFPWMPLLLAAFS